MADEETKSQGDGPLGVRIASILKWIEFLGNQKNPTLTEKIARWSAQAHFLIENIKYSEALLLPADLIAELDNSILQSTQALKEFETNKSEASLDLAIKEMEASIRKLPIRLKPNYKATSQSIFDALSEISATQIESLRALSDELKAELASLREEASSVRGSLKRTQDKLDNEIVSVEERFNSSQTSRSERFEESIQTHARRISDVITELTDKNTEQLQSSSDALTDHVLESQKSLDEILLDSEDKHQTILKLYQLVGRDTQIGGFQSNADKENRAAIVWDTIGIITLAFAIAILVGPSIVHFFDEPTNEINWINVLVRVPISTILLSLPAYALNEARKHKRNAQRDRDLQLQIGALDPYLSSLPKPVQDSIRAVLTPRYFIGRNAEQMEASLFQGALDFLKSANPTPDQEK